MANPLAAVTRSEAAASPTAKEEAMIAASGDTSSSGSSGKPIHRQNSGL